MSEPEILGGSREAPPSDSIPQMTKPTWSSVVQSNKAFSKHDIHFTEAEGGREVIIPDDIIDGSVPLWDDMVLGKFLSKAPHVAKVHMIVNKIWPIGDRTEKIDVFVVDETSIKFKIKNPLIRSRVLKRGMWNIADVPMIVSKWSPVVEEEHHEITSIPMWITMKNVPPKMFSEAGLAFIASAVGDPKKLHPDTIQCKQFDEAKIFVEAELEKGFPNSFRFNSSKGVNSVVEFNYPWLPTRCEKCSKWGHGADKCSYSKERLLKDSDITPPTLNDNHYELLDSTPNANLSLVSAEEEPTKEVEQVENTTGGDAEVGKTDEIWSQVPPAKSYRSPGKASLEYGQVQIIKPSKFSVLSEEGEEGELKEDEVARINSEGINDADTVKDRQEKTDSKLKEADPQTEAVETSSQRLSLPRNSKKNHRFVSDSSTQVRRNDIPAAMSKKGNRKQN